MGKADHIQPKLSFKGKRKSSEAGKSMDDLPHEEDSQSTSMKTMFLALKHSLVGIDAKLEHLTEQMDHLKERLDDHDTSLEQVKSHISDLEESQRREGERLLQLEWVLELIRNKNKDLEACSRRNNLRILGLPESTAMGRMEDYAEVMLTAPFPGELSPVLVVERVQRLLGPLPPPRPPVLPC
ncbi:hypothetical protein NDU88_002195 [Pleurodeles waltl]|uniref:Uncharacterized protein n=1 Tax=Pleurodeles waltl TaxID=8319 RepID=A0AAV7NCZ5_PLEWA|nr:hypothetical protein NDU88_002195 [Pleurodeles waltl]